MNLKPFLDAIISVSSGLTLIAFIAVVIFGILIVVLNKTGGLDLAQRYLGQWLNRGEFYKLVRLVSFLTVLVAAMLFTFLAYQLNIASKRPVESATVCFTESCTGRDPNDNGCDKGAYTITSTVGNFPNFGDKFKNTKIEMRNSDRCNASWVKSNAPVGSRLYIEDSKGEKYGLGTIPDGLDEPYHNDMAPANMRRKACIEVSGYQKICTNFIN